MRAFVSTLPVLAILAVTLALLTRAGRLYRRGELQESGRRSRGVGVLAIVVGLVAVAGWTALAGSVPNPALFGAGMALTALAALAAALGGLSRKPVPSVYVAWASFSAGILLLAAAFLM